MLGIIFRKAQNKIRNPARLRRLIDYIDEETWMGLGVDVKGDIYEGLLEKNAQDTKSGAGQYFMPRPLIEAMVEVVAPDPDVLAAEIVENLGAALEQFSAIQEELETVAEE